MVKKLSVRTRGVRIKQVSVTRGSTVRPKYVQKDLDLTKPLSEHIFPVPWLGWIEINANV